MRTFEEIPEEMIRRVLKLSVCIQEGIKSWEEATAGSEPTLDYLLGNIVIKCITPLLRQVEEGGEAEAAIRELFAYFEDLLEDENLSVRDAVDVSFCEKLETDREATRAAVPLMGPLLRQKTQFP